ncbi:hypothetical protein AZH51_01225 [Branchiibius sp. NY16-3462-2]|nr:hypothetical protein AZH51_01225 [Branchiibius sp. NY16-3462-2]
MEWHRYHQQVDELTTLAPELAAFKAAAEQGHITRAAAELGIPQSTMSRRIKTLERVLGQALVQPHGRGMALTPAGRSLLPGLSRVLDDLDREFARLRGEADPESGLVRFGFPLTVGPRSTPALLAGFYAEAPRVRLILHQGHGGAMLDEVRDGRLDLAIVTPPPDDLDVVPLGYQYLQLNVGARHRLAKRRSVRIAELADEAFIAGPTTYSVRRLADQWCLAAGFRPRIIFEGSEIETLRALVAQGLGVALLPPAELRHEGLVEIPLAGGTYRRQIALVCADPATLSPAALRLRAYLADRRDQIGVAPRGKG